VCQTTNGQRYDGFAQPKYQMAWAACDGKEWTFLVSLFRAEPQELWA
jgi:hypothetical protein